VGNLNANVRGLDHSAASCRAFIRAKGDEKKQKDVKIAAPKEYHSGETRVPLIPGDVKALIEKGAEVEIESGMGVPDRLYFIISRRLNMIISYTRTY
jgi:hypothetical protein